MTQLSEKHHQSIEAWGISNSTMTERIQILDESILDSMQTLSLWLGCGQSVAIEKEFRQLASGFD